MALAITATIASPGPSSGVGDVVDVQALAWVLLPGGHSLEHPHLVCVHRHPPVVVGDVERADGVVLLGKDGVEDLLHGWPPLAEVVTRYAWLIKLLIGILTGLGASTDVCGRTVTHTTRCARG